MAILLPHELAIGVRQRATKQALLAFETSLACIYVGTSANTRPTHVGTGIFARHNGQRLVLTASHVSRQQAHGDLLVGDTHNVFALTADYVRTGGKGPRDNDVMDYCAFAVSDQLGQIASGAQYVDLTESSLSDLTPARSILVMGFPTSKHKKPTAGGLPRSPQAFLTRQTGRRHVDGRPEFRADMHVMLDWTGRHSVNAAGHGYTPPHPEGMSGGAIIDLGWLEHPEVLAGGPLPEPRLIGLTTSWIDKQSLVGTRLSVIVHDLAHSPHWPPRAAKLAT